MITHFCNLSEEFQQAGRRVVDFAVEAVLASQGKELYPDTPHEFPVLPTLLSALGLQMQTAIYNKAIALGQPSPDVDAGSLGSMVRHCLNTNDRIKPVFYSREP